MEYQYGKKYRNKATNDLYEISDIYRFKDGSIEGFDIVECIKDKEIQQAHMKFVTKNYFDYWFEERK